MRKLLIPLAVLVGVLSLAGCGGNALTEEQIRQIVREEISQVKQGPKGDQGARGTVGARGPAGKSGSDAVVKLSRKDEGRISDLESCIDRVKRHNHGFSVLSSHTHSIGFGTSTRSSLDFIEGTTDSSFLFGC
jgi:hypothetical protein